MKISADTNVLVRIVMADDAAQTAIAQQTFAQAEAVHIAAAALCELCWVLTRSYGLSRADVALAIRALTGVQQVQVNQLEVEAGLKVLEAGGDFADGIIAFAGTGQSGCSFVSFDRKAVRLVRASGAEAILLK